MRPGRLGPGRSASFQTVSACFSGFNEAGAIRPRKGSGDCRQFLARLQASMRPGRLGPGRLVAVDRPPEDLRASMRPGRLGPGRCVPRPSCGAPV